MKLVVYLTKTKIWYDGKSLDWGGSDLIKIFSNIRSDERVREVRIVLGNDVSFVASFKAEDGYNRDKIEETTRGFIPFPLEENCFDFRFVIGIGGEKWVQSVAVEKWLLTAVSSAVWESGLSAALMIPIGVLLGEKTTIRETPVLVKWTGFETLKVLAVNGLCDSAYTEETDEEINEYARNKWKLEADPEQLLLDNKNFNMIEETFKEKNKGEDVAVLNIPVLKKEEVAPVASTIEPVIETGFVEEKEEVKKRILSKTTIFLIVILVVALGVMSFVLYNNFKPTKEKVVEKPVEVATITVTPVASPSAAVVEKVDLSKYTVQVLNGSGVTGEAGRIKELLVAKGFVTVDTGNGPDTTVTQLSKKTTVDDQGVAAIRENVASYKIGDIGLLTSDNKYDLVIVLGSEKI